MRKMFILAACLLAQPTAASSLTVAEALAIKERAASGSFASRAEWSALGIYLQGAVEAVMTYRDALDAAGASPLFCPPRNSSESIGGIVAMLEAAKASERDRQAVALVLETYAKKYPC